MCVHQYLHFITRIDLYADHDVYKNDFLVDWQRIAKFRKPTIAAVSGYAVRVHYSLSLTA